MQLAGPERAHRRRVLRRDVADVRAEPVPRVERIEPTHDAVTHHLRDDGRGRDRGAARVAVHERPVRRRGAPEPEPVHETRLGRRMQVGEDGPQAREIRAMEPGAVDISDGHDPDADARRAADDAVEELLALLVADLLRVVQARERADTRAAQRGVVEEDPRDDERPGERASARLVCTRDEADAEAAVVCEEALAGRATHRPRIDASPAGARGRAPSSPLSSASSRASPAGRRRRRRPRASRSSASGAGTYARPRRRRTACGR